MGACAEVIWARLFHWVFRRKVLPAGHSQECQERFTRETQALRAEGVDLNRVSAVELIDQGRLTICRCDYSGAGRVPTFWEALSGISNT
jgi:hypothetical protein